MVNQKKENNGILTYSYRHNEWVVLYNDMDGFRCYKQFDTKEEAIKFFGSVTFPVSIMTTGFYNHCKLGMAN